MIRVTITGADDRIDVAEMQALSRAFPFLEWALLFSPKHIGVPRYPSPGWVESVERASGLRLAMHLCGAYTRTVMSGQLAPVMIGREMLYRRVQLNGFQHEPWPSALFVLARECWSSDFILQCRSEATLQAVATLAGTARAPMVSQTLGHVLFDPSGGEGRSPLGWPSAPAGARMGYAGGIGPDNVEDVIGQILEANGSALGDFWIDMESGVRVNDCLDPVRVRAVLEKVAAINARLGGPKCAA